MRFSVSNNFTFSRFDRRGVILGFDFIKMTNETKLTRFAKYCWFVLAYNLLVIIWGVFLRASKSGDGCGMHWLTCHGEVVPSAPELKTVIEFSHRITSALDGVIVIGLLLWTIVRWRGGSEPGRVLKAAIGSFVLVVIEGLLGAGLVLTGNTAENLTAARPFWMGAHLLTTLVLLAFLTFTAWFASGRPPFSFRVDGRTRGMIAAGVLAFLLVGMTGSIAALTNLLYPSNSIAEGIAKDFAESSNILLRLRIAHPIVSTLAALYLLLLVRHLRLLAPASARTARLARAASAAIIAQVAFGSLTLLMLAPILMQVGHLLLADFIWILLLMLTASALAERDGD